MQHLNIPVLGFIDVWSERISKWLMVIAAMWAFLLAFYILVDVIGRFFGFPLKGTHEIVKITSALLVVNYIMLALKEVLVSQNPAGEPLAVE